MKTDNNTDSRFYPARLSIIMLVIGLLIAVAQFFSISNEISDFNQTGLAARGG